MSNRLPSKPQVDTTAIQNIKDFRDLRQWLKNYTTTMEKYHLKLKDTFDNFGMGTADWNIRQATADDVAVGNAQVAGNLIAEHKTNGTKHEFQA